MLSGLSRDTVRTKNIEDILLLQEEGHLSPARSDTMGVSTRSKTAKPTSDKPAWKFPTTENAISLDEKNDTEQASRRTKHGWQSPHYALEDGYTGEKSLTNGGQSRHRKTASHGRTVSISSGYAGLGSGRRVDAFGLADLGGTSGTDNDEDHDGIKISKKVEVPDRRAEVSAGLTGKDRNAFILLIVLCRFGLTNVSGCTNYHCL
jgi:hypothetical protein